MPSRPRTTPASAFSPDYLGHASQQANQLYLDLLAELNPGFGESFAPERLGVYPGSPYIATRFLEGRHKLKLYELHPTDFRALSGNMEQLELGRSVACHLQDGFEALKPLLPPLPTPGK